MQGIKFAEFEPFRGRIASQTAFEPGGHEEGGGRGGGGGGLVDIGGGAWPVRFQGCNKAINKIGPSRFSVVGARLFLDVGWCRGTFTCFRKNQPRPLSMGFYQ